MGHHSLANMLAVRSALDALTVAKDGVNGSAVYLYGEAWNFGEVIDDSLFVQARQANIAGSGIGTFNDRMRDGVRGGGPFDSDQRTYQGFATGLFTDPNGFSSQSVDQQLQELYYRTDLVRLGLVANLADFVLPDVAGQGGSVVASQIDYGGQAAGYTAEPQECINYVDAHDNETIFDNGIWKLPVTTSMASRIRLNNLALATTALGQAPSFWHAGADILRSKSLDRNSYNAGDHFNAIDWTLASNVFGTGLPMASENQSKWTVMAPLLANPDLKPTAADLALAQAMSLDLLRLRSSTPLLTLGRADLIKERVHFLNAGLNPTPGLLVMLIEDPAGGQLDIDSDWEAVLVVFNASPDPIREALDGLAGRKFELHPVQLAGVDPVVRQTSYDPISGTINLPAQTVAVLVQPVVNQPALPVLPDTGSAVELVAIWLALAWLVASWCLIRRWRRFHL
jgi:pullulanase-type alpha-1,6-glucosidase